nr:D-alanyl-D-alanine carboxypeptidase [uncultured Eisenbergiella sp.]
MKSEATIQRRKRQRRRRRRRIRRFCTLLVIIMIAGLTVFISGQIILRQENAGNVSGYSVSPEYTGPEEESEEPPLTVDVERLYSPVCILEELDSGEILASRQKAERIYPASLTKIMTAILAIENTPDLEQTIPLPDSLFSTLYIQNASMAGFQPGEEASGRDLLYGILLPSGAECCLAFASNIAGSERDFVGMMNRKADQLGMENTHFCNSTGLHEEDHYSTAEDIAILLRYALANDEFRKAFTASRYSTSPTALHPDGFTFSSSMFQYMDTPQIPGGEILGGKTGYTSEAGLCLASLARIGDTEYILVTAGAAGDHQTKAYHILDAESVYGQIGKNLR